MKDRRGGRIVSISANTDGRREALDLEIGASLAEPIRTGFLRKRGLRGVKPVIGDAHEGSKAAATGVLGVTRQRCRVHVLPNPFAHAGTIGRRVASAFFASAFAQDTAEAASAQLRAVTDRIRPGCRSWPR